jgi:hypothetical protein
MFALFLNRWMPPKQEPTPDMLRLHPEAIYHRHVWYRLCRYIHGEHYGECQLKLGFRYFLQLDKFYTKSLTWCFDQNLKLPQTAIIKIQFWSKYYDGFVFFPILLILRKYKTLKLEMRAKSKEFICENEVFGKNNH